MEENIILCKLPLIGNTFYQILNRNRIKNDPKRIDIILEFEITESQANVFGKTGTQRQDPGTVTYGISRFGKGNFGHEIHASKIQNHLHSNSLYRIIN